MWIVVRTDGETTYEVAPKAKDQLCGPFCSYPGRILDSHMDSHIHTLKHFALIAGGLLVLIHPSTAQGAGNGDSHHRSNCRLAQQVLIHGRPANEAEWAFGYIRQCEALGAETASVLLGAYRTDHEPTPRLEALVEVASMLVDQRIVDAAIDVAADRSAGRAARVQAMRIIYSQLIPGVPIEYEEFVKDPLKAPLAISSVSAHPGVVVTPIDSEIKSRIESMIRSILTDSATEEPVRHAAERLSGVTEEVP